MSKSTPTKIAALVVTGLCVWATSLAGQQRDRGDVVRCSFEGQTYFPFGYYDPFQPNDMDVVTQIGFRCYLVTNRVVTSRLIRRAVAKKPKVSVEISMSTGQAGTYDRRMRGVNDEVLYNVFLDPNGRDIWGDGSRGTNVYSKKVDVSNGDHVETIPVYGRMPAGQNARGGPYADMLVLTIDF